MGPETTQGIFLSWWTVESQEVMLITPLHSKPVLLMAAQTPLAKAGHMRKPNINVVRKSIAPIMIEDNKMLPGKGSECIIQ